MRERTRGGTPLSAGMHKAIAFSAVVASAAAFTPAPGMAPSLRAGTAVCANKFGQAAPAGAPPADLFNIWRDDYMLTPAEAAAEVGAPTCPWRFGGAGVPNCALELPRCSAGGSKRGF